MSRLSLTWRISLQLSLVVCLTVGAACAIAYVQLRAVYLGHLDRMLRIMARGVLTQLDEPRSPQELQAELRLITESPWRGTGTHYRVWFEGRDDDLVASVPPGGKKARFLWEPPTATAPQTGETVEFDAREKKKHFRLLWLRHATGQRTVNVIVAHPSSYEHRRLTEVFWALLGVGIGSILIGTAAGAWLVSRALRPIRQVAWSLSRLSHDNLRPDNLQQVRVPRELRPFVAETRRLLERLDVAIRRLKQFTSDASHELRTPLAVVRSTLELARSARRSPAEYEQAIDETLEDLERLESLLEQLLLLARLEEDGLSDMEDLALDELLRGLAGKLNAVQGTRNAYRIVCEHLSPCRVRGSEQLLAGLFRNLLDNAVKYGPSEGRIHVRLDLGPDAACTVAIQDDGGGIAPDELPHLFDRFYRARDRRGGQRRGAGLGLPIARSIACRHGGDVWATCSPEKRTTFFVRLPRV